MKGTPNPPEPTPGQAHVQVTDWGDGGGLSPEEFRAMAELCRAVASAAAAAFAPPGAWLVEVGLTGDRDTEKLNTRHRGRMEPTDVLSFPLLEPAQVEALRQGRPVPGVQPPDGSPALLGDVVINVEEARRAAQRYGHSFRREVAFLTAHGTLHLLGFDHDDPEAEEQMNRETEVLLESLGLGR